MYVHRFASKHFMPAHDWPLVMFREPTDTSGGFRVKLPYWQTTALRGSGVTRSLLFYSLDTKSAAEYQESIDIFCIE